MLSLVALRAALHFLQIEERSSVQRVINIVDQVKVIHVVAKQKYMESNYFVCSLNGIWGKHQVLPQNGF